jgi:hypothetical protein
MQERWKDPSLTLRMTDRDTRLTNRDAQEHRQVIIHQQHAQAKAPASTKTADFIDGKIIQTKAAGLGRAHGK